MSANAAAAPKVLRCELHQAVAGWQCTVCHQPLCPDCAAIKHVYPAQLVACARCGELAEELVQKKSHAQSLAQRLPGAFALPFQLEGAPLWLGLALWLWLTSFGGVFGLVIGWGVTLGALFGLTRSSATGHEHLSLTDFTDTFSAIVVPVARFAVITLPAWGGALLAWRQHSVLLGVAALVLTLVWSPTAYIGAAVNASFGDLLNPLRVLRVSASLGKDLGVYVSALVALGVLFVISVPIAVLINQLVLVPFLGGVLVQLVLSYAPMVGARVAGLVLLLHGPSFGWGTEADGYEPLLRGETPRGTLPEKKVGERSHAAIELEAEPVHTQAASMHDRFAALEVDPGAEKPPDVAPLDVALLPSHGERAAQEIRAAIAAHRPEVALDGFRATGQEAAAHLLFDELLWLAQTAASHIDYESAELGFRKSIERAGDVDARCRAQVMLARLLGEKLNRADEARAMMEQGAKASPDSKAGEFAARWLGRGPA
ncbi:MAG: B-box zinc finger protein [Myxococcaceae bacterium]